MKKITLILVMLSVLISVNSCKKSKGNEPIVNNGITAEKTNVKTYEIINLIAHENLADSYNASFGSASIELLKTSDSTLTFYVPEVENGEVSLNFELGTIRFNVTKTQEINSTEFLLDYNQHFDAQISLLKPVTPFEWAEVDSMKLYKQEVLGLFNSLSDDEKRQTVLFYEANKDLFQSFSNSTFNNLDGSTVLRRSQSQCPTTDFKSFYSCTAENLGDAATDLKNVSKEFLKMMALAGASAYLAPASFGLSAFGTTLALGTAGYLYITEVKPAWLHFRRSLKGFLEANWIFGKALFIATTDVFYDQMSTSLSLSPKFRSITYADIDLSAGCGFFIEAMASLSEYWNKMTAVFGSFPNFLNTEEVTTLETNEISISNISNSNVQYLGNTGQALKFKTLSGKEESFTFDVRVNKEGFVEEKTLTAKVTAAVDSMVIYKAAAVGNWTMKWYDSDPPGIPTEVNKLTFNSDGTGSYYWKDGAYIPSTSPVYRVIWSIVKYSSGEWNLNINYPDRGWYSSAPIFLTPNVRTGVPEKGLYYLGEKD